MVGWPQRLQACSSRGSTSANLTLPLGKAFSFTVRGDVGGFGVGSDLAWHAYADIGYCASDLVSIILGYRAIDIDYEDGKGSNYFKYDMATSGPAMGVIFTF